MAEFVALHHGKESEEGAGFAGVVHGSSHYKADWRRPWTGAVPRCRVVGTSDKETGCPATEMPSNPGLKEGWL